MNFGLRLRLSSSSTQGLNPVAAEKAWATLFASPTVRRDQVDAVNESGVSIGKVEMGVWVLRVVIVM